MTVSTETVIQRCSVKKVFLEILQNSQKHLCQTLFFNKVAGLLIPFFIKHLRLLLLLQDLSFTCTLKIFFR